MVVAVECAKLLSDLNYSLTIAICKKSLNSLELSNISISFKIWKLSFTIQTPSKPSWPVNCKFNNRNVHSGKRKIMYCCSIYFGVLTFHNLSITYDLSCSIIDCTKFLCGRKKNGPKLPYPKEEKVGKSPYIDHRFLNVATTIYVLHWVPKKICFFSNQ
jgi:hypothetical protein